MSSEKIRHALNAVDKSLLGLAVDFDERKGKTSRVQSAAGSMCTSQYGEGPSLKTRVGKLVSEADADRRQTEAVSWFRVDGPVA